MRLNGFRVEGFYTEYYKDSCDSCKGSFKDYYMGSFKTFCKCIYRLL